MGLALAFLLQSETYEPVLLQRRVNKMRKETGNLNLYSKLAPKISAKENMVRSIVRPLKALFLSPIVAMFSLYMG